MDPGTLLRTTAAWVGYRPVPLTLIFELTHLCNLACVYCDRHTPMPQEMTREQIFTALGEFIALGTQRVNLDGGEPLAHRHVEAIVAWLTDQGISTRMNSNGILIPRKIETVKRLARVKISLDGLRAQHDAARGQGAFEKAIAGALAAREAGVPSVEFTCVVGQHNAEHLDALLDLVEELGFSVIFQPARHSLFLDTVRDGSAWQAEAAVHRAAFARLEQRKHRSPAIANSWSSLRHFRAFPDEKSLPCAAGWIEATMDPEGNLFHCGEVRSDRTNNVVRLGAAAAFARLTRVGCDQCWCARTVEGNYLWGLRLDMLLPARRGPLPSDSDQPRAAGEVIPQADTMHSHRQQRPD